ncbi:MAG: ATP-binding protein, partial [Anaerolineales bacterium]|nr:ATP-binding protein [Anaerolineales bacterium]
APLRSLDGFSSILLEEYSEALDAPGKDYLNRIKHASKRMGQLIDDLLQLSRISQHELNKQYVDLSGLARSEITSFKRTDPSRSVTVVVQETDRVLGDPRLLAIALNNLLGNAWKYTSKSPDPFIEFGAENVNGETVFYVRDNGVGFDMAYSEKLFGAFQRLHSEKQFPGTGIGLATVKRVIKRHGGRIWAHAAPEQGATFFFTVSS